MPYHTGAADADRVTWLGIWANLGLFALKALAGVMGRSAAMIADAGHTLSDLVSDMGACVCVGGGGVE
jgi:divalent metal cation (Fe/Co/Zn/Cd) transporter